MKSNRAVRLPGGLSFRLDVRALTVVVGLLAAALAASVVLIGTGDFPMSAADVLRTLAGEGDAGQELRPTSSGFGVWSPHSPSSEFGPHPVHAADAGSVWIL